ncbi:GTP-binding protein [Candidatus Roizmanbacteria bacterium]|nr:GTP-binding protein [Candidatus Roizmanbacteria bacterium]
MQPRPPVVTILGHVDHGKTTLLDYIRKSTLAAKESGGITQRIGAYEITKDIKVYKTNKITFIDTPGHEAFSQLRARGANVADIALLLIDAKDSIMPQTEESIAHINNAKIPFIVVATKTDLPEANIEKVKNDLLKHEIMVEGKGGHVSVVPISAKTGKGVNELLEMILLVASDLHLSYDLNNAPKAYIIETKRDKRGLIISAIIKDGTLKVGDTIYSEDKKIKVRSMINDLGKSLEQVFPSTPFEILGFETLPEVGTLIQNEPTIPKGQAISTRESNPFDMKTFLQPETQEKKLSLIIKADSQGMLEAITNTLSERKNVEVVLKIIGDINKSDVFLAKTTKSIIIGFSVHTASEVNDLAKQEKVIIKTYNIIYELLDELIEVAELLKEKEEREKNLKGEAKILATFVIEGERIFGVKVTKGKINLNDEIEQFRQNNLIAKTKLISLKTRAKVVSEVKKEQEAGMIFSPPLDFRVGDVVKSIS